MAPKTAPVLDIDHYTRRRRGCASKLVMFGLQITEELCRSWSRTRIQDMREQLAEWKIGLDEIYDSINLLCEEGDDELTKNEEEQTRMFAECNRLSGILNDLPVMNTVPLDGQNSGAGNSAINKLKLPPMTLPTFDGNLQNWSQFHDRFIDAVHNDSQLPGASKMHYLKSSLQGEAAQVIQTIQVSDTNYERAWKAVVARYERKRTLVNFHVRRLFTVSAVQTESAVGLRNLIDSVVECSEQLEILGATTDIWDVIRVYLTAERLDCESRKQWELLQSKDKLPSFEEITKFVNNRATALASIPSDQGKVTNQGKGKTNQQQGKEKKQLNHVAFQKKCVMCNEEHLLYRCEKFVKLPLLEKKEFVVKKKLCYQCLNGNHMVKQCKFRPCGKCRGRHNLLLHEDTGKKEADDPPAASPQPSEQEKKQVLLATQNTTSQVLLATALVKVQRPNGGWNTVRALIDMGSETSLITDRCCKNLGLVKQKTEVSILGIGATTAGTATKAVSLCLGNSKGEFVVNCQAYVFPSISQSLPKHQVAAADWPHIEGLELADPNWRFSSRVDLLLGADVWHDIILDGVRKGPSGTPVGMQTAFGWLLVGRLSHGPSTNVLSCNHVSVDLDSLLQRFWEVEEVPTASSMTAVEALVEENFVSTHRRDSTGRYIVELPFTTPMKPMGSSRNQAVKRFMALERKLNKHPVLKKEYTAFIDEYLILMHMERIRPEDVDTPVGRSYYLPHHCVIKEDSTTTKLRVVYDGSAPTETGVSLNDNLMVGQKVQQDLFVIIVRFRKHPIAFSADITKMYRQILVCEEHQDYLRIVWRFNPDDPIEDYRLCTVTYGTAAAPHLATRVLKQLAIDYESQFPEASKVCDKDFYVDDVLSGGKSVADAVSLQSDLIKMLACGGFDLRKWSSNSTEVLNSVPVECRETKLCLDIDTDDSVKTLGLRWHPASDVFKFCVSVTSHPVITKRTVASDIAKVFDPLGSAAPVTICAKLFMQSLWSESLGWDDPLPEEMCVKWKQYQAELKNLELVSVPRCVMPMMSHSHELHGFSDASLSAYAACVYVRSVCDNDIVVQLVASKTRVAPIKFVSLPRLELLGAHLLSRLMKSVLVALEVKFNSVHCWSDSKVVLDWLASEPSRWKTFVANRVSKIQELEAEWHHVPGEDNPADAPSRGITAKELHHHPLWWHGPPWLRCANTVYNEVSQPQQHDQEVVMEEKKVHLVVSQQLRPDLLLHKCGTLRKLLVLTAFLQRIIRNRRKAVGIPNVIGPLSVDELQHALKTWIKIVQREVFQLEFRAISSCNEDMMKKSKTLSLNPFIDCDGLLKVGGRLENSDLPFDRRHPILLPQKHHLTVLIVVHEHQVNLHAGCQLLLRTLQDHYWIINGREVVRRIVRNCVRCCRLNPTPVSQLMSDLPAARVTKARPFQKCGVDYAGPFTLRVVKVRSHTMFKAYIALFVCFTTRAIHLELVTSSDTASFISALKRFVGRRGKPSEIFSDNGTNFVGANNLLNKLAEEMTSKKSNDEVQKYLASHNTKWTFNPAAAPHFGGLWEAGVKSLKKHLYSSIGQTVLNFEEMYTVLCQVEGCLNSRPLCQSSADPNDFEVITPGHFLTGAPLNAVLEPDRTSEDLVTIRKRWHITEKIHQEFWRGWSSDFLSRLQQRPKWWIAKTPLEVGSIVVIKDENLPPRLWSLARVIEVHPGKDGLVRTATVMTKFKSKFVRPVVKLCPLPIDTTCNDAPI